MIISASICISDIDKSRITTSEKNGKKYYQISLFDNDKSEYSDGYIVEDISREEREGGAKGKIIGNWKWRVKPEPRKPVTAEQRAASKPKAAEDLDQGVPF